VGVIAPSSAALSQAIAQEVHVESIGPVIELGLGTGVVTKALVERRIIPDRLALVEFYRAFCAMPRARYLKAPIVHADAYDVLQHLASSPISAAPAVITGLARYVQTVEMLFNLLRKACKLMAPGAPFIQFTYAASSPIPQGSARIWLNLPPART